MYQRHLNKVIRTKKSVLVFQVGDKGKKPLKIVGPSKNRKRSVVVVSDESELDDSSDDGTDFLDEGDKDALPPVYFTSRKSGLATSDVAKLLLGSPDVERIATFKPYDISRNSVYVFKTEAFTNIQDVLSDGCGVWKGTGTKTFYAKKSMDGSIRLTTEPSKPDEDTYKMTRRSYQNKDHNDVKRSFVVIRGKEFVHSFCARSPRSAFFELVVDFQTQSAAKKQSSPRMHRE